MHYAGGSVHNIDEQYHMKMFLLGCKRYNLENQTVPKVRRFVDSMLLEFGLKLESYSYVVFDNENKMKTVFPDVVRVGCFDCYLSKILQHGFTTAKSDTNYVHKPF